MQKKWNGIRDSLRRVRQKRKRKSGQADISTPKYKYETLLEFLIPHLADRKGLTNVQMKKTMIIHNSITPSKKHSNYHMLAMLMNLMRQQTLRYHHRPQLKLIEFLSKIGVQMQNVIGSS